MGVTREFCTGMTWKVCTGVTREFCTLYRRASERRRVAEEVELLQEVEHLYCIRIRTRGGIYGQI